MTTKRNDIQVKGLLAVCTPVQVEKFWDSFAPSKSGGGRSTYMQVTVGQQVSICATISFVIQMMSAELGTEGRFAPLWGDGPSGSLTRHIDLRNMILQRDERGAGEEYSVFCATL